MDKFEDPFENAFSLCEINWNIKNFCFVHPHNNYVIFSPDFVLQGLKNVKWRMSLELENKESCDESQVSFYLEKLPISEGNDISVNWELTLTVGSNVFGPYEKTVEFKEQLKHGQIGITSTTKIFNSLIPIQPDTLHIRFYFTTIDREIYSELEETIDLGLLHLSEDLLNLKLSRSCTDVKIKVNDAYIEAHKVILSINKRFVFYMKESKNDIIEISSFDYEILDSFINFLYSGNVKYLRRHPSLAMIRCLEEFDCDALRPYCIEEAIQMESKIKVDTHEFHWHVTDIFGKDQFVIKSPPTKGMHTTWQLTLFSEHDDPNKNLSLYAEITDGDRPLQFCLEFCLINVSKKELFPRRLVRIDGCCDDMGFDDFVSKKDLTEYKSLTLSGALCIFFRAKTSTGKQEMRKGRQSMSLISTVKEDTPYHELSEKIGNLFQKLGYSDIILHVNSENFFKAHRCILEARSPGLKQRIADGLTTKNYLMMGDIDPVLLELIVNYMYSGTFSDEMKLRMSHLYYLSAPEKLDVPSLYEHSLKYMKSGGLYVS